MASKPESSKLRLCICQHCGKHWESTLTCDSGSTLIRPDGSKAYLFRCPKCQALMDVPGQQILPLDSK